MTIKSPYYPIVYVRGFAATMNEIEETVATPYMGFNLGSTKIRLNYEREIVRFIFESPLLRLMKDKGYVDTYKNGDYTDEKNVSPKSIWVFRYYEPVSDDLGMGEPREIPDFAADLRKFILRIRDQVCKSEREKKRFKVYLVAHSMGGLICRCYIQNICVSGIKQERETEKVNNRILELPGKHLVDKIFTYATPHNGIDVFGLNAPDFGSADPFHVKNFNRKYMKEYLNIPNGQPANSLNGKFPPEKFFCFVGTNYKDYQAFFKLSKKATGPMSDGLVMIRNATVLGSPRSFGHRSHSGHFGIVNSEEGYQNLRRFLFGQVRVNVKLLVNAINLPPQIQKLKIKDNKTIRANYNIETTAKVRGAYSFLHERKTDQSSAILKKYDDLIAGKKEVFLFTTYLDRLAKSDSLLEREKEEKMGKPLAFAVWVGIQVPLYEVDEKFWFDDHFEGGYLFQETITFHIFPDSKPVQTKYGLASRHGMGQVGVLLEEKSTKEKETIYEIPVGFMEKDRNPPQPGFRGKVILEVFPWND